MSERSVQRGEPYEMDPEEDARVAAMIDQADRDIEEMRASGRWGPSEDSIPVEGPAAKARAPQEAKVTMRWPREQLDVVRRAADLFGMPYQTYVKQAAFRAALDDLHKLDAATSAQKKGEAASSQLPSAHQYRPGWVRPPCASASTQATRGQVDP